MEGAEKEERSAEQAASLFGAPEVESQGRNSGSGKKSNWKIIAAVSFKNTHLPNEKVLTADS